MVDWYFVSPTPEELVAAHSLFEVHREPFVLAAQRALVQQVLMHNTGTINDVRNAISIPLDIDPRALGAVPGPLAKAGIIRRVSFQKTNRKVAHARHVSLWELLDPAKAQAWLNAHPVR